MVLNFVAKNIFFSIDEEEIPIVNLKYQFNMLYPDTRYWRGAKVTYKYQMLKFGLNFKKFLFLIQFLYVMILSK